MATNFRIVVGYKISREVFFVFLQKIINKSDSNRYLLHCLEPESQFSDSKNDQIDKMLLNFNLETKLKNIVLNCDDKDTILKTLGHINTYLKMTLGTFATCEYNILGNCFDINDNNISVYNNNRTKNEICLDSKKILEAIERFDKYESNLKKLLDVDSPLVYFYCY